MIASGAYLQNNSDTAPSLAGRLLALFFLALLGSFACAFCWSGVQAITTRRHEVTWRQGHVLGVGPIAIFGPGRQGVEIYAGADAIRMGVGLIASAIMFGLLSATVLSCGVIHWPPAGRHQTIGRLAVAVSLFCMFLLSVCFFPPWQLWAMWFWAEILVWVAYLGGSSRRSGIRNRGAWLGMGTVVTAIVLGVLAVPGASVGLVLGLFAFMICFSHMLYLSPRLMSWLDQLPQRQEA